MAENKGNWFTDLYGEDALEEMLQDYTEKELFDVNRDGVKFKVRVIEQQGVLIIDLWDKKTGKSMDRIIPVGGFTLEQRQKIGQQALAYAEQGLPIMWKEIISPMIKGYWDEEWDVVKVHDIDKSNYNRHYAG